MINVVDIDGDGEINRLELLKLLSSRWNDCSMSSNYNYIRRNSIFQSLYDLFFHCIKGI